MFHVCYAPVTTEDGQPTNHFTRFLFYSHDGLGLGHTRRHLAVAGALTQLSPDASVLLVTGADDISRLGLPPRVEFLKLPGLRKVANGRYLSRYLQMPVSEIRALRAELLLTTVKTFRPGVVLVDKHPFGASGEFKASLLALREFGGRAALGLRDILDEPARVLAEWQPYDVQRRIAEFYDLVLVYGDRSVFDPTTAYRFPRAAAERTRFCGHVVTRESDEALADFKWPFLPREERTCPVVLATAGGGEDGFRLLETFIRAAAEAPWQGVVITGPMTPASELTTLERCATEGGVALRHFVPHLSALFDSVDALVCMGGYNTLAEAVSQGVPAICVPRVTPRTEQLIRAAAFEKLGLLSLIQPDQLTVEHLRRQVEAALAVSRDKLRQTAQTVVNFDGARRAARHLLDLAASSGSEVSLEEYAI